MNEPQAAPEASAAAKLWTRIASALVLLTASVALVWAGYWPFAGLVLAVALTVLWEWSAIARGSQPDAPALVGAAAVVAAVAFTTVGQPSLAVLAVAVGAAAAWYAAALQHRSLATLGVVYAGLPAVALVWLRSGGEFGLEAILFVLAVVWTTDSAAFFAGRAIGGAKLCVSISPNKTWAGLLGGVAAAGVVGWSIGQALGTLAPGRLVATACALALVSQMGDLAESAYKRANGVKDAGRLIPGHGGFMDRVDGLIFAAVAAAVYAAVLDPAAPGAALLALK